LAVKIRLRRVGAKKQPSYRVVVADSRSPRDGRFIEVIGHYNPRTKPTTIVIDADKARKWLGNGALPTESVASLLYRAGIIDMRSERYKTTRDTAVVDAPVETPTAATVEPSPAIVTETLVETTPIETAPVEAAPVEATPSDDAMVAEAAPSGDESTATAQ